MYTITKTNLARNALIQITKKYNIIEIFIPYYLCDVVRHALFKEGIKINYYHIADDFMPACEFNQNDFILYPNYFGICENNVDYLIQKYQNIIIDNAHSFYSEPKGLASFCALHKFFDMEGAFCFMQNKTHHNNNKFTNEYLSYKNNEELKNKRYENFLLIHEKYKNINLLNIDINSIPFCYPLLLKTKIEANKIAKELQQEGKIIYRYWNNLPSNFNEYKFYTRLVPIPII